MSSEAVMRCYRDLMFWVLSYDLILRKLIIFLEQNICFIAVTPESKLNKKSFDEIFWEADFVLLSIQCLIILMMISHRLTNNLCNPLSRFFFRSPSTFKMVQNFLPTIHMSHTMLPELISLQMKIFVKYWVSYNII